MSERRQINIRLGDDDFERKISEIRRAMVIADARQVPTTADVVRAAIDHYHRELTVKIARKRG